MRLCLHGRKFLNSSELDKNQYGESLFSTYICLHVCHEKKSFSKTISQVKYFTPEDMKTISLQNNRKFMPGI